MSLSKHIDSIILLFCVLLFSLSIYSVQKKINGIQAEAKKAPVDLELLTLDSSLLKIASAGQQRALSSILWVTTLMSSDYVHHNDSQSKSWMYYRFENIASLDTYFFNNYLDGGLYLSVIKDDVLGAEEIYDKGLALFPYNYWLNFYSGFNLYFELDLVKDALKRYEKIIIHPLTNHRFSFLKSLVARLQSENGDLESSLTTLKNLYLTEHNEMRKNKLADMIYANQAEIDLNCLNSKQEKPICRRVDAFGLPYILKGGNWTAQKKWKPVRSRMYDKKKGLQQ